MAQACGGISGNDGVSAGGRSQAGARDVKTLICETNFSCSSRLDAVIIMTPGITQPSPKCASRRPGKSAV